LPRFAAAAAVWILLELFYNNHQTMSHPHGPPPLFAPSGSDMSAAAQNAVASKANALNLDDMCVYLDYYIFQWSDFLRRHYENCTANPSILKN